MAENGTAVASA